MGMFRTILTAVDFSEMSGDVLHYAARLAAMSPGARLLVANVVPDPLREPWMVEAVGMDFAQLQKAWIAEAYGRLEGLTQHEGLALDAFETVVVAGKPADALIELASDRAVDAIVIGTHGYGAVKHMLLGSVAERVLRHARCPVITVPHKSLATLARQGVNVPV